MNFLSLGKIAFGTLVSGLSISDVVEYQMNSQDTIVKPPIDTVSIILCTYNEAPFIEQCIQSLRHQSIIDKYPEYFEILVVDSGSSDNTVELAKKYLSLSDDSNNSIGNNRDKLIITERGKLTARNIGTYMSAGNIIVSVDADTVYSYNWLNTLLKPFRLDPNVVAVHGSTFDYTIPNIPGQVYTLGSHLQRLFVRPTQMTGRNSAFYKHLFYLTGGFDESIDQTDVKQMLQEEEYSFGEKLSQFGKVIYKMNACCNHLGGKRIGCRLGVTNKELCNNYGISIERFG